MENTGKRRESFVDPKRKSLTFTNLFNNEKENSNSELPRLSMKNYLGLLLKEKNDWKELFKETKKICEESERKYKFEPYTIRRQNVLKSLSAEDRLFYDEKPNYAEMLNTVQRYIDSINYINLYKSDVIDSYNKALNEIEINNKYLADEMSSKDLCDVCNMRNCNNSSHKFAL